MARIDPSAPQPTPPLVTSGPTPSPAPAPAPKPKRVLKKKAEPLAPPSESGWWVGKKPFHYEGTLYQPGHPVPNEVHQGLDPAYRDHLIKNDWFIGDQAAAGKLFHKTVNEAADQTQPIVSEKLLDAPYGMAHYAATPLRSDQLLERFKSAQNPQEQKKIVHELAQEVGLDLTPYTVKTTKKNPTGINLVGVGRLLGALTKSQTNINDIVKHFDPATANTLLVAHAMVNIHADAEAQLRHESETGKPSARAWYEDDIDAMEAGLHQMVTADPKLAGLRDKIGELDETGRHTSRHDPLSNPTMGLLKVLVGITSGGNTPKKNMGVAIKVLEHALRDPRVLEGASPFAHLPTHNVERFRPSGDPKNFPGQPGVDVTGPKLSRLVTQFGEAEALKWLLTDHTGHEIRHFAGNDVTLPDGVNAVYPGSYIFGQKLGPFVQNLFRRSTELTADRWFVRTWRRIMGDLTGFVTEKGKTEEQVLDTPTPQMKRMMGIATKRVAASLGMSVSSLQAVLWYYEKRLWRAAGTSNPEESYSDAVEKEIQRRGLPAFRRPRPTSDPVGPNADTRSAKPIPLHRRRRVGPIRPRSRGPIQYAAPVQAPGKSAIAWSPNVDENLDFGAAWDRMRSGNHKAFGQIADHVLKTVGLGDYKSHPAIGDWSDGAENSFAHVFSGSQDPEKVKYAASWLGLLANQKAVMAFHAKDDGPDRLYSITLKGTDATRVRKGLDAAGLQYRTLVPTRDGFHVLIYDEGAKSAPSINQFAEAHDASVLETAGSGSFIGAGSRSEARHVYRQAIDAYEAKPNSSRYRPPVRGTTPSSRPQSVYQMRRAGQPTRYAQVHAPADGIVVRGVFYPGGKFIPTSEIEKASPQERVALEAQLGGGQAQEPQQGQNRPAPTPKPQSDPLSSRLSALAQAAASAPPALVSKAKSLIQARYQKLVERYGPKGAATVLVATALLTPVPLPGTSLLPIALAEGIKLAKAALSSRRLQPVKARRSGRPIRYEADPVEVARWRKWGWSEDKIKEEIAKREGVEKGVEADKAKQASIKDTLYGRIEALKPGVPTEVEGQTYINHGLYGPAVHTPDFPVSKLKPGPQTFRNPGIIEKYRETYRTKGKAPGFLIIENEADENGVHKVADGHHRLDAARAERVPALDVWKRLVHPHSVTSKVALSRQNHPIRYSMSERESQRTAFQQALHENPLDGNARLQYSDWLEENNEEELAARQRTMGERWERMSGQSKDYLQRHLKDSKEFLTDEQAYPSETIEAKYRWLARHYTIGADHWGQQVKTHPHAQYQHEAQSWLADHFAALEPKTKTKNILRMARSEQEGGLESGPTTLESSFPAKSRSVGSPSKPAPTSTSEWTPEMTSRFFKENDRLEPAWRDRVHRVNKPRQPVNYTTVGGSFGTQNKIDWTKYDHDATVAAHTQRYRDVLLHPDSHLTRLHQQRYDQSLSGLLSRFPPVAVARLHAHTRDYNFGKDPTDLLRQVQDHDPSFEVEEGESLGGLFHPDHGVYLDGDLNSEEGEHVGGKAEGIHAHELGHAIDGTMANRLSSTGHWKRAWDTEMSEGALSNYATTSPSEGFAELVQALYASKLKPEQIEAQFPLSSYLFKEWGLWPGSPHPNEAAPTRPLQPADPAPERGPRGRR